MSLLLLHITSSVISPCASQDSLAHCEDTVARCEYTLARSEDTVARSEYTLARLEDTLARLEDTLTRSEDTLTRSEDTLARCQYSLARSENSLAQRWFTAETSENPDLSINSPSAFVEAPVAAKSSDIRAMGSAESLGDLVYIPLESFMPGDFPLRKDADLLTMATASSALITASPTTYNLVAGQATTLAGLLSTYSAKYALANGETTRTRVTISEKDDAKRALVANLRDLNRYVQAGKTVTDAQKLAIKFPVYASRSPIHAPATSPVMSIKSTGPWRITLNLKDADTTRRGLPAGVRTAFLFMFVGAAAPTDVTLWQFQGSSSKPTIELVLDPSLTAGSTIWLAACWLSPRQQPGDLGAPISTQVPGGVGGRIGGVTSTEEPMKDAA